MTILEWISTFKLGETRRIPTYCGTGHDLIYEAKARFGFTLVEQSPGHLTRVCPLCGR